MDLHKQVFNQEVGAPRANMATPVELPGDKVCALPAAHLPLPLPLIPFAPSSSSPFLLPRSAPCPAPLRGVLACPLLDTPTLAVSTLVLAV